MMMTQHHIVAVCVEYHPVVLLLVSHYHFPPSSYSATVTVRLLALNCIAPRQLMAHIPSTRSTQPCITLGSLNRVPALIGWGKDGNVTSAGWQVILCDPI